MFTESDIFYTVMAFATFIIVATILVGYLGSYAKNNSNVPIIEGFEATEDSLDGITDKVSESVTDIEDQLRVDKYKNDYKKLSSLTKDYFNGLNLAILLELKGINPKRDKSSVIVDKCNSIADKLTALHSAIETLDKLTF